MHLPHTDVVDPEGGGPVLVVDGALAAVPRADGGVHHQRHGLVGHLARRRALALLVHGCTDTKKETRIG